MSLDPPSAIFDVPAEVILHIFSYLDLPDLAAIVQVSPTLAPLASDPVLHKNRIRVVAPSRVRHSLFGVGPRGLAFRPTVSDLIRRGVIRGLDIERRWRTGYYIYSRSSVAQYENGLRLARQHASHVVSLQLKRRSSLSNNFLTSLHLSHVLPDIESSSLTVSRILLPIMHQLKWSLQRDKLAKMVRTGSSSDLGTGGMFNFGMWLENKGQGVVQDGERVRLAICPDIRKIIRFYEGLGVSV